MSKLEKRRSGWELASPKTSTSTTKRQNQFAHSKRDDVHLSHIDDSIQDESSLDMTWLKTMRKTLDEMLEKDRQKELDSSTVMEKEEVRSVDLPQSTFYTCCTIQSKVALVAIDERKVANVASTYSVEKLGLTTLEHPKPYTLQLEDEALEVQVTRQVKIPFSIGTYQDEVLCDVASIKSCHLIFGKPWKDGRQATKDQKSKKISFVLKGKRHQLIPMATNLAIEEQKKLQERIESWEKECIERDEVKKQESEKEEKQSERRREEKKEKREKLEIECEKKVIYIDRSLSEEKKNVIALENVREEMREKPNVHVEEKGKEICVDLTNVSSYNPYLLQDIEDISKEHNDDVKYIDYVFGNRDFFHQDVNMVYCIPNSFESRYFGLKNFCVNLPSHLHMDKYLKGLSINDKHHKNDKLHLNVSKLLDMGAICLLLKLVNTFSWQGWVCFIFYPGITTHHESLRAKATCMQSSYILMDSSLDPRERELSFCFWKDVTCDSSFPSLECVLFESKYDHLDLGLHLVQHCCCELTVLAPNFSCICFLCIFFLFFFSVVVDIGWFYIVFDPGIHVILVHVNLKEYIVSFSLAFFDL